MPTANEGGWKLEWQAEGSEESRPPRPRRYSTTGSVKKNLLPSPTTLSTQIRPS
jgi:hypothetical protein